MKSILVVLGLSLTLMACDQLKSSKDENVKKVSYAIGRDLGQNFKMQQLPVDAKMIAKGIQDSMDGKDEKYSQEEVQEAMKVIREKKESEAKEQAKENVEKGKKFLEENKSKEGVKVTESGLQYKILEEGEGDSPAKDDTVSVHYVGTLLDGTEFDSSVKRGKPVELKVNGVIPGWTEALQMMKKGSKWKLFIPSDLAYGERAAGQIPPNSTLIFEVELLNIKKK